jgi:hypothetical protein
MRTFLYFCCILVSLAAVVTVSGDGDNIRYRRRVFVVDETLNQVQRDRALVDRHEKRPSWLRMRANLLCFR